MKTAELMKTMKLLYVEDEKETREELVDVLKRRAGKVYSAENGVKGLSLAEDYNPDIVIADLYMPEMNGLEMIRRIREQGMNPAVIILSAINDVSAILDAIDVGIDKYILKPVNLQELLDVLAMQAELIASRRKHHNTTLPENRKQVEDEIKREFAAFFKTSTGKGPKDVNVFLGEGKLQVVASDVMTVLEKSLMENGKNAGVIKYVREVFFSSKEKELCQLVSRITGLEMTLKEVSISVEKNKNKLVFEESYTE